MPHTEPAYVAHTEPFVNVNVPVPYDVPTFSILASDATIPTGTAGYTYGKTFGNSSISTGYAPVNANRIKVGKFAMSDSVDLAKLTARVNGTGSGTGNQVMKGVIYDDDGVGGLPGTLLGTTDEVTVTDGQASGWVDLTFAAPVAVTPGNYWLGLATGANASTIQWSTGATGGTASYNYDAYAGGPAATYETEIGNGTEFYSIYATYDYTRAVVDFSTYYVDASGGDDDGAGTIGDPWQTVAKVEATYLMPGDTILFKRGEVWRNEGLPYLTYSGLADYYITYGAYGTGSKPLFLGSVDLSSTGDWTAEGATNVWQTTAVQTVDIGNLIFNDETDAGFAGEKFGTLVGLAKQGDFFHESDSVLGTQLVCLYSVGNPGTLYSHIEAATSTQMTDGGDSIHHIVFENLAIRYTANGGFVLGKIHPARAWSDFYVQLCDLKWIGGGGGVGPGHITSVGGDAVGAMGPFTNFVMRYCTVDQCFDGGFSVQWSYDNVDVGLGSHIYCYGNIFRRCAWGHSAFHGDYADVIVCNNVFYEMGNGFPGAHANWGTAFIGWSLNGRTHTDCAFRDNIIHASAGSHIYVSSMFYDFDEWAFSGNRYYPDGDEAFLVNTAYVDTYFDFAGYQARTGWDADSTCALPPVMSIEVPTVP